MLCLRSHRVHYKQFYFSYSSSSSSCLMFPSSILPCQLSRYRSTSLLIVSLYLFWSVSSQFSVLYFYHCISPKTWTETKQGIDGTGQTKRRVWHRTPMSHVTSDTQCGGHFELADFLWTNYSIWGCRIKYCAVWFLL